MSLKGPGKPANLIRLFTPVTLPCARACHVRLSGEALHVENQSAVSLCVLNGFPDSITGGFIPAYLLLDNKDSVCS